VGIAAVYVEYRAAGSSDHDIDIEQIILSGADILVETDAEGYANYQFETSDKSASVDDAAQSDLVIPLIRNLRIADATFTYRDGITGREQLLMLDELVLARGGADQPLKLQLTAVLNKTPVSVRTNLGSPFEMLTPAKPWPLDAVVDVAGSTFTFVGNLAEPTAVKCLDVHVEA
jgi:uncharacterized protein involved in outer membrane biogenesis